MNTIYDKQNEKNFYGYCQMLEYNHDYEIFLLFGVNNFTL